MTEQEIIENLLEWFTDAAMYGQKNRHLSDEELKNDPYVQKGAEDLAEFLARELPKMESMKGN